MLQQMWLRSPFSFTRFVACLPPVLSLKDIIGSSIKKTRKVYTAAQPRGTLACALTRSGSIFIVLFSREKERESSPAPYRAQHAAQCLPARTVQAHSPSSSPSRAVRSPLCKSPLWKEGALGHSQSTDSFLTSAFWKEL